MSWVAVAVGGGAAITGYMQYDANQRGARAAGAAAGEQSYQAQVTRDMILRQGAQNVTDADTLAQASPEELNALGRSYQAASTGLDRESKLLASIDPALMEASDQALKLLRGETASINKPMQDLRNSQRQQLLNSLRSQYGPGAESSSIGQQALQKFDMETNSMFAQNQQSALAQVFNIANTDVGSRQRAGIASLQQVGQGYSALQDRRLNAHMNASTGLLGALSGTSQQMIQTAGAPYVGDAIRAQGQQALGQNLMNTGTGLGTAYLMSGRGGNNYNQAPNGLRVEDQYGQSMTTDQLA